MYRLVCSMSMLMKTGCISFMFTYLKGLALPMDERAACFHRPREHAFNLLKERKVISETCRRDSLASMQVWGTHVVDPASNAVCCLHKQKVRAGWMQLDGCREPRQSSAHDDHAMKRTVVGLLHGLRKAQPSDEQLPELLDGGSNGLGLVPCRVQQCCSDELKRPRQRRQPAQPDLGHSRVVFQRTTSRYWVHLLSWCCQSGPLPDLSWNLGYLAAYGDV